VLAALAWLLSHGTANIYIYVYFSMCDWNCKSQHGCVIRHGSLWIVQTCPDSAVQTCPNSMNAALATFEWAALQSGTGIHIYLPLAAHNSHRFNLCSLCSSLQVHPPLAEFACACSMDALDASHTPPWTPPVALLVNLLTPQSGAGCSPLGTPLYPPPQACQAVHPTGLSRHMPDS
jgi:hypothetical protein